MCMLCWEPDMLLEVDVLEIKRRDSWEACLLVVVVFFNSTGRRFHGTSRHAPYGQESGRKPLGVGS